MTSPNLSEIVTTTLRNRSGKLADNVTKNNALLSRMKKNADGSVTLYVRKDSPGKDKESNWLPAPDGPIYVVMRLYWPKEEALKGEWKPPAVKRVTE